MSKAVAYCTLIVALGVVLVVSVISPNALSDSNKFLQKFVGEGLLDVLGVILAITLASAGQLHLTLNQIEEKYKRRAFERMRKSIRGAATALIALFAGAVVLVVTKPLIATTPTLESIFNGFALFILLWNVLLLISLTQGIFAIKSEVS